MAFCQYLVSSFSTRTISSPACLIDERRRKKIWICHGRGILPGGRAVTWLGSMSKQVINEQNGAQCYHLAGGILRNREYTFLAKDLFRLCVYLKECAFKVSLDVLLSVLAQTWHVDLLLSEHLPDHWILQISPNNNIFSQYHWIGVGLWGGLIHPHTKNRGAKLHPCTWGIVIQSLNWTIFANYSVAWWHN